MSGGEEETVTLSDVLEAEAHWEETTNAVLGGSDNKNCSYSQGYVKRQALYACLTCTPVTSPDFVPAGICLACSLKCHDGHELVELYTKRNFRCDCGNNKFPDSTCSLEPKKDDVNEKNTYNQNFRGLYCECHRPYPDPEEDEDEDDEMIQCIVCEDWLHGRHTGNDSFDPDSMEMESELAAEFICAACTKKNDFLAHYSHLNVSVDSEPLKLTPDKKPSSDDHEETVDVGHGRPVELSGTTVQSSEPASKVMRTDSDVEAGSQDTHDSGVASGDGSVGEPTDESQQGMLAVPGTSGAGELRQQAECLIEEKVKLLSGKAEKEINGSTWWSHGWRSKLCRCSKCLELYETHGVSFLVDPEDSLEAYEAKGLKDGVSTFDSTQVLMQNVLSRLDRVAQIEFLHGFNEMKDNLVEFLRNIGESGRVVTAADIREFFGEMQAAKRRRLDNDNGD